MVLKALRGMLLERNQYALNDPPEMVHRSALIFSKMKRKGMTRDEAIRDIYDTATKTNANVNRELGLGGD